MVYMGVLQKTDYCSSNIVARKIFFANFTMYSYFFLCANLEFTEIISTYSAALLTECPDPYIINGYTALSPPAADSVHLSGSINQLSKKYEVWYNDLIFYSFSLGATILGS